MLMDIKKTPDVQETGPEISASQNTSLLRMGVLFLAVVSFFTTANGMKKYIFTEDGAVAYAASAAIQSILLALSMNLPKYLKGIWRADRKDAEPNSNGSVGSLEMPGAIRIVNWMRHNLMRLFLCSAVIVLTFVAIFCSSWFSYVYIAEVLHKDSWEADSELLVQQTYRAELYGARDYAHIYRTYLEESVGEDILLMERQSQMLNDPISNAEVDWDDEILNYASGNGTAAVYMSSAILTMREAMENDASQEDRDLAAIAVATATENIENRIETVQATLERIDGNLERYNTQMANLETRIRNATEETDIASLSNSINNLNQLINSNTQVQIELQQESEQLNRALQRLPYYESLLGLSNSTSLISIRSQLIQMQSEFFKSDPDDQVLLNTAAKIFENLRNAAGTIANGENDEFSNEFSYTNLLVQMNRLIRNLTDYSEIKAIEANLDGLITALRTTSEDGQAGAETDDGEAEPNDIETDQNGTGSNQGDTLSGQNEEEAEPNDIETDQNDTGSNQGDTLSGQNEAEADTNKAAKKDGSTWEEEWRLRIESLKAQISAMPTYSETGETETNDGKLLTGSQLEVLRSYDRSASSATLDDTIRRYISGHNAVYQGIIYLMSPYKMLAIFALCLALSFDLSGFVFGFVMQGEPRRHKSEAAGQENGPRHLGEMIGRPKMESRQTEWSVLNYLNQYRVLTGDFSYRNGTYYYKVFQDGLAKQWAVKKVDDSVPYVQGIYCRQKDEDKEGRGKSKMDGDAYQKSCTEQALIYSGQSEGPQDGVFENCCLSYTEGALSKREKNGAWSFICSLEEYVPVHCYSSAEKENRTFPAKQLAEKGELTVKIAVLALNKKGTRVSAIYMIRGS